MPLGSLNTPASDDLSLRLSHDMVPIITIVITAHMTRHHPAVVDSVRVTPDARLAATILVNPVLNLILGEIVSHPVFARPADSEPEFLEPPVPVTPSAKLALVAHQWISRVGLCMSAGDRFVVRDLAHAQLLSVVVEKVVLSCFIGAGWMNVAWRFEWRWIGDPAYWVVT